MQTIKRLSLYLFLGLLSYIPLHIFLSTWVGTSFGILSFMKGAKDGVMVVGFSCALIASWRQAWFGNLILKNKLTWLLIAYTAVTLLMAALKPTDPNAEALGVVYNLRFLVFFAYAGLLVRLYDPVKLRKVAVTFVLLVALPVLFFGVLQYTILPNNSLGHVGYSRENGVLPAFFIDDKPDLERVMSTLRDPNAFGSYIIIITTIILAFGLEKKLTKPVMASWLALCGLCMIFTFSRSAWIGLVVSTIALLAICYRQKLTRLANIKIWVMSVITVVAIAGITGYAFRNTYLVRNIIFHADEHTVLEDPNEIRTRVTAESIKAITTTPLGHGPGTAGLASIRNHAQGTRLTENYYLQIGYETGLLGIGLFLIILLAVGLMLFRQAAEPLALALVASLAGLMVTNLLVHIWSNEAVAYTWWGLAGFYWTGSPAGLKPSIMRGTNKTARGRRNG